MWRVEFNYINMQATEKELAAMMEFYDFGIAQANKGIAVQPSLHSDGIQATAILLFKEVTASDQEKLINLFTELKGRVTAQQAPTKVKMGNKEPVVKTPKTKPLKKTK